MDLTPGLHDIRDRAARELGQVQDAKLPEELRERLDGAAGFVEVSVGRMVPAAKEQADPLLLRVEPYDKLPYDTACWRGEAVARRGGVGYAPVASVIERKV